MKDDLHRGFDLNITEAKCKREKKGDFGISTR